MKNNLSHIMGLWLYMYNVHINMVEQRNLLQYLNNSVCSIIFLTADNYIV